MSIHDKLAGVAAELHLAGFGSELTEGVKRIAHLFADEIHSLGTNAAEAVKPHVEKLVADQVGAIEKSGLDQLVQDKVKAVLGDIDERVKDLVERAVPALFEQLLAKAAAADAPKPPAEATEQPSAATQAGAAAAV